MSVPPLALVTGGCRRLGAAIAARLAEAGYALALHGSHDAEPDADLRATIARCGTVWRGFVADFAAPETASALYADVVAHCGRAPDLLVNAASVFGQDRLDDTDAGKLAEAFAVNCAAAVLLVQAFASTPGEGRAVVNIVDQRIAHPHPDQLAYTLGKLGLAGLTAIGAEGVRMNAVAPGLTLPTGDYTDAQMVALADLMPLQRLPRPEDVAEAVLFLARTPGIDRQTLFVDGGAGLVAFGRDFVGLV